jgi:geranylgeranyl reductase family protein
VPTVTRPEIAADVIVVGLGPAGACAAAAAARAGARVIALDRRRQLGWPVQCAELVPRGLALEIAALDRITRQRVGRMLTHIETASAVEAAGFRGHMIDRADFDARLAEAARAAGADCRFAAACVGIDHDGCVRLASGHVLTAPIIIAADGPRSMIGRAIGLANTTLVETRQITVPLQDPGDSAEVFLTTRLPGGYGWLFPAGSSANLGVGAFPGAGRLKSELDRLRDDMMRRGRIGTAVARPTGGAIPAVGIVGPVGRIGGTTVLLAGDAAGLANPVSGAGIAAACISGRVAGAAAAAFLSGGRTAALAYAEEIEDLFGPSLARALARRDARPDRGCEPKDWRRSWIGFPEYWQ